MNSAPDLLQSARKTPRFLCWPLTCGFPMLLLLFTMTWSASAQTVTWQDSFTQGVAPTVDQCKNWGEFLRQIEGKHFASVTMSGEYDKIGRTITDPAAASELARLLSSKTPGVVTSGGHTWTITNCELSICKDGFSVSLSVDGNTAVCDCKDTYTIRPQSLNQAWGGINTETSCNAKSQYMKLEFHSGVSIVANGSTVICDGGSVLLTANATICSSPYTYLWSNGATTPSITVTNPGSYSVTVSDASGCKATSATMDVIVEAKVNAGEDVTICEEPIQLNATGTSIGGPASTTVNSVCLFDAPGGSFGQCNFIKTPVCREGETSVKSGAYTQLVSFENPVELRYKLYYRTSFNAEFLLKLNGHQLGVLREVNTARVCMEIDAPQTLVFRAEQFMPYWKDGVDNAITVEIVSPSGSVDLTGFVTEVVTSNESYSWSPAAGLNTTGIRNPVAAPTETTLYTVTYTDAGGCVTTDQVEVKVKCNTAPVAVCKEVSVSPESNCEAIVEAVDFDGGSSSPSGSKLSYTVSPAGPYPVGVTEVTFTVTDTNGKSSSSQTKVIVKDSTLPIIETLDDIIVANDPGECFATLELTQPEASDNCGVEIISSDYEGTVFPQGETIVTWTVTDTHGNKKSAIQKVNVINAVPEINAVVASTSSVVTNRRVALTIAYTDNNVSNATIDWGDNATPETITAPATEFEVSHTYSHTGSYSVKITLTDQCGQSTFAYEPIVVSHPPAGSVTGGGWYESPRGAYVQDQRASGKATFAFNANNVNKNRIPEGHVVFNFNDGNIKFRSTHFEWLYIEDETASMKAVGRLNGNRNYQILISVAEEDKNPGNGNKKQRDNEHEKSIDLIRVKIWDPSGLVIYDTQLGSLDEAIATTPVNGGSIKIEKEKVHFNQKRESPVATSFGGESSSVYPNPFEDWVDVEFNSSSNESVVIQVMNLSGKVIYTEVFPVSEDGKYPLNISDKKNNEPGIYVLVIKQGKKVEFLRLVRN